MSDLTRWKAEATPLIPTYYNVCSGMAGANNVGRTVVEGEWPYKLAPGVRGDEEEADESSESEEEETGAAPGTVYRLTKGQLKKLDGGMEQYAEIAARTAARLGRRSAS